jgi:hypothetical protein
MKSAYSILAQDCESSDFIARHASIKAVKPKKVMLVQVRPSVNVETALDEYTFERDAHLSELETIEDRIRPESWLEAQGMHLEQLVCN